MVSLPTDKEGVHTMVSTTKEKKADTAKTGQVAPPAGLAKATYFTDRLTGRTVLAGGRVTAKYPFGSTAVGLVARMVCAANTGEVFAQSLHNWALFTIASEKLIDRARVDIFHDQPVELARSKRDRNRSLGQYGPDGAVTVWLSLDSSGKAAITTGLETAALALADATSTARNKRRAKKLAIAAAASAAALTRAHQAAYSDAEASAGKPAKS